MAQHPRLQVGHAAVRVDQRAVRRLGDGVEGEVAAQQVFLQGDRRRGIDDEAAVAAPGLALGAGQCVLFAGVRVQEHGEVAADRAEAGRFHRLGSGADDHPVAVAGRQAEQAVAHRAADQQGAGAVRQPPRAHAGPGPAGLRVPARGDSVRSASNSFIRSWRESCAVCTSAASSS